MSAPANTSAAPGNSIRDKLHRLVLTSVAGALLTAAVLSMAYQGWMLTNTLVERMSVIARILSANVSASLEFGDARQAEKLLLALRDDQDIVSAAAVLPGGLFFAGYGVGVLEITGGGNAWLQQALADSQPVYRIRANRFEYVTPVILHDEMIGYLYLASSLDGYYHQFMLWAMILFAVSLIAGWLTLRWTSLLQSRIVAPFFQLSSYMGRVSEERDFSLRVPKSGLDEVARLTDGFNNMLSELEQRDHALKFALIEANEARASAEAASQAKSLFLATMSHEIRTPMNGVLGMAEMLLSTRLDNAQRHYAESVLQSGQHLLGIINDILDFSKIESGHMALETVEFDLGQVIEETLAMFAQPAADQKIELLVRMQPPNATALFYGDPFRLRQILANLVSNALKFTEQGSVVVGADISAPVEGSQLIRLSVRDTGIGIAKEAQSQIFEQFRQADGSTTRQFGGTGLGLAICQRLVSLMGGRIGVDSEIGKGALFWVEIHLKPARFAVRTLPPVADEPQGLQGHVLLAEDNPVNQHLAEAMLASLGLTFDTVANGEDVLALAAEKSYALILMDCNMPRMDGYEATERWREREAAQGSARLPIIALTANAMENDRQRCFAVGMDDYLAKPFMRRQFAQTLARWLPAGAAPEQADNTPASRAAPENTARPDAPHNLSALDAQTLAQLGDLDPGGRAGLVQQVLSAYQTSSAVLFQQLSDAVTAADAEMLRKAAHSLKSASANVGALRLSVLFGELEAQGRQGRLEEATALLAAACAEYNRAMGEIALVLKGSA